jgi:type II secretory pathway pseudopilin PulG
MLVSCTVFAVLSVMLLQVFSTISLSANSSKARSEVLRQAIGALERVNYDLDGIVQSGDWSLLVVKGTGTAGNDSLIFLAPVNASQQPAGPRQLSLVRYAIENRTADSPSFGGWPAMPAFSRAVRPFSWNDDLGAYLPFSEVTAETALIGTESQQIAPGVIRYEVCFQLWDGTITATEPTDTTTIRALICGIVSLDRQTAIKLSSAQLESLPTLFPKARDSQRPLEAWSGSIEHLPLVARKTVHIYEQTIPL